MSVAVHFTLAVAVCLSIGTGCGPKRPPVVAGPGSPTSTSEAGTDAGRFPSDTTDMGPDVQPVPDGGVLEEREFGLSAEGGPLADVLFDYDSASLSSSAQDVLPRHVLWLKDHPTTKVFLEGHCDERGTVEYNLALGERRAQAVYDYLTSQGIPGARLSSISLGKERPLEPGHDEAAWAKNRRVHFAVSR